MKSKILLLSVVATLLFSCQGDFSVVANQELYDGPTLELFDVEFYYSDSAQVIVKGTTPHRMEFEDGNQEFPKGIYLEFFDDFGKLESTIKANQAYFDKEKNEWLGQGDVVVKNIESGEQLNTEELYWLPAEEKIHTEKFVTIKRDTEVLHGRGLEAAQDMSTYTIQNPEGEFILEENKPQSKDTLVEKEESKSISQ